MSAICQSASFLGSAFIYFFDILKPMCITPLPLQNCLKNVMKLCRFRNWENGETHIGAGSNAIGIRCLPVCMHYTVAAGMDNNRASKTIILHTYQTNRIYWCFLKV